MNYKINLDSKIKEAKLLSLNSNKANKKLNWKCTYGTKKSIQKTINWYLFLIKFPNKIEKFTEKQIKEFFLIIMNNQYLRKIENIYSENGNISKFLQVGKNTKKIDEIYFSEIKYLKIKCWKKHIENNLRIYVIKGHIRFIIIKNKKFVKIDLKKNYLINISLYQRKQFLDFKE